MLVIFGSVKVWYLEQLPFDYVSILRLLPYIIYIAQSKVQQLCENNNSITYVLAATYKLLLGTFTDRQEKL